jgi:hypothetical protein
MTPTDTVDRILDPIETLNATIESAWFELCQAFDATGGLPDTQALFDAADLSRPNQAAEAVLAAMLLEVMECVGRFSPWYKMPVRAFGLISMREAKSGRLRWILAPEAVQRWQGVLEPLSTVIRKYSGLIQALVLVDDLMQDIPGDPSITACCSCLPPHAISIRQSVLVKAEIICESCLQPYRETIAG